MAARKIKIGFDAKRLFFNNTGLGNYSRNLVSSLNEFFPEFEIHLFTPRIVRNKTTQIFLEGDYMVHTCPWYLPSRIWRSWLVSYQINALHLDIFHGLSQEIPHGISSRTKTIVSIHDLIANLHPELFKPYDAFIYQRKMKSACLHANAILAISQNTKRDIITQYSFDEEKINVVYQSCDSIFQESPVNKVGVGKYFLYVGSIIERKGLMDIVETYRLSTVDLPVTIVIGEGLSYFDSVKQMVSNYGLQDKFKFLGSIENKELVQYYDNAIALILPSLYEGFGIPIIEALFRKCPVICYNTSSLPEAGYGGTMLVAAKDIVALQMAMIAIQERNLNQTLAAEGHEYVIKKFSKSTTTQALAHFYEKVLNNE